MEHPNISIIIPVLNQKKLIEKGIRSVLNQNFTNYELIIIDGGSTDGTIDIIQKYKHKISYYESRKDKNLYEAMNKGIEKSNAKWLYFMGADDQISKNILSSIFKNTLDNIEIIFGNIKYIDNTIFKSKFTKKILINNCLHHQSAIYNKSCFNNNSFNTNYPTLADYDFNLQLFFEKRKTLYLDAEFAICGKDGISKQKGWLHYKEEFLIKKERLNAVQLIVYGSTTLIKYLLNLIGFL